MKFFITGTRRGLGKALVEKYGNCNSLEDCNVFINNKCDRFEQVFMLYHAAEAGKRIINISSNTSDRKSNNRMYAVYKGALDDLNDRLYCEGYATTSIRFGYFDSPRVEHIDADKMPIDYCVDVIDWILKQPYVIKEITITPEVKYG